MKSGKIKMVLVGLRFGRSIVEGQLLEGPGKEYIELAGVYDMDEQKCMEVSEQNKLKAYGSWDEILNDPEIEAVGLYTGPNGRADLIRKIICAGKHVMTTKPFELDPAAALKVMQEARELNKIVHLNSPGPLPTVEVAQVKKWVEEYNLGRQTSIHWETYGDYHEKADGSWYDDPVKCPVAPIFRLGIYGINMIISLSGKVADMNVLQSRIRTGRPTPDNALLSLLFENGSIGTIYASFCIKDGCPYPNGLKIHYERGTITIEPNENVANYPPTTVKVTLQSVDGDQRMEKQAIFKQEETIGRYQWQNFYEAVRNGAPLPGEVEPEQVAEAIKIIKTMSEMALI